MPITKNSNGEYVLFIHIPKNGGTTIESCFNIKSILFSDRRKGFPFKVNPQHFDAKTIRKLGVDNLIKSSFAIVRNPIDRLISEYHWCQKRNKLIRLFFNFDTFVFYFFSLYKKNPYINDNHITPQKDFILNDTIIYKFESGFNSIILDIEDRFKLIKSNEQHHQNKSIKSEVKISSVTFNTIVNFYKMDFLTFDYKVPDYKHQPLFSKKKLKINIFIRIFLFKVADLLF